MLKEKLIAIRNFLVRNSKIVFPILLTAAVAATVSLALGASGRRTVEEIAPSPAPEEQQVQTPEEEESGEVSLVQNEDPAIERLITDYYTAQADGDLETLQALCDYITDKDLLLFQETARYIDSYPVLTIYTKPGYAEGETIAYVYFKMLFVNHEEEFPGYLNFYVGTREDGSRYIVCSDLSPEANEYAKRVSEQDDVIEFMNRIVAEFDAFKEANPDMAEYPKEVTNHVSITVGELLAKQQAGSEENNEDEPQASEQGTTDPEDGGPKYATATTMVNVRSSDSEKSDRVGRVSGGAKIEVLEERVNGWTKVRYEGKEGFIKSEYLQMREDISKLEAIGTVKANTTVNVRMAPSTDAEKLGLLNQGSSTDLFAVEGEWCKIKYNDQVGYVKAEFVEQ